MTHPKPPESGEWIAAHIREMGGCGEILNLGDEQEEAICILKTPCPIHGEPSEEGKPDPLLIENAGPYDLTSATCPPGTRVGLYKGRFSGEATLVKDHGIDPELSSVQFDPDILGSDEKFYLALKFRELSEGEDPAPLGPAPTPSTEGILVYDSATEPLEEVSPGGPRESEIRRVLNLDIPHHERVRSLDELTKKYPGEWTLTRGGGSECATSDTAQAWPCPTCGELVVSGCVHPHDIGDPEVIQGPPPESMDLITDLAGMMHIYPHWAEFYDKVIAEIIRLRTEVETVQGHAIEISKRNGVLCEENRIAREGLEKIASFPKNVMMGRLGTVGRFREIATETLKRMEAGDE